MIDNLQDAAPALMALLRKRCILPTHVAALRASELGIGLRTLAQAEALLAVERSAAEKCRQWGDFLVETLVDYLVWDEAPTGCLTEARARWLLEQVGEQPTPACMALLVTVLDEAPAVPGWFPEAVRMKATHIFAEPGVRAA